MPEAEVQPLKEGEKPYTDLVRIVEPYLDTAPRGPWLVESARNAVRRVCRDLNVLQERRTFDRNKEELTYELDHTGYDFSQFLGAYYGEEHSLNRLDASNFVDIRVGRDVTVWTFTNQEQHYFDKLLVRYSIMPSIESQGFPRLVQSQFNEILRLALLADIMPYVHSKNKRVPVKDYDMEYNSMLRDEKYRASRGYGGDAIPMFTEGESDYSY